MPQLGKCSERRSREPRPYYSDPRGSRRLLELETHHARSRHGTPLCARRLRQDEAEPHKGVYIPRVGLRSRSRSYAAQRRCTGSCAQLRPGPRIEDVPASDRRRVVAVRPADDLLPAPRVDPERRRRERGAVDDSADASPAGDRPAAGTTSGSRPSRGRARTSLEVAVVGADEDGRSRAAIDAYT